MLRNDLIVQLSQHDNDAVTVNVNGIMVDVESVTTDRRSIIIQVDPEDLASAIQHHAGPAATG